MARKEERLTEQRCESARETPYGCLGSSTDGYFRVSENLGVRLRMLFWDSGIHVYMTLNMTYQTFEIQVSIYKACIYCSCIYHSPLPLSRNEIIKFLYLGLIYIKEYVLEFFPDVFVCDFIISICICAFRFG